MKQRLIKMYSFDRENISDAVITSEDLDKNIISISESFLTYAYECYKGIKLKDEQLIEEIIKVMLPSNEEDAETEWLDGLSFNDKKYYAWFATTGGMKKEGSGKCETIFVEEGFKKFTEEFEELISLGKFKEIEELKEKVCINKDILSRISLGLSNSVMAGDMPDITILPQPKIHIDKDYKTVKKGTEKVEDKDGNKTERVNYELEDYHFNDKIDVFDGGGLGSPKVFDQIKKALKVKYDVEFAIIRGYGTSIKGMVTKFKILEYLNEIYVEDTDFCKKENGSFYLKDMWNKWQKVTDKCLILNESMVKLAKYYDDGENYDTIQKRLQSVDEKYKNIINKLYVTKINKSDEEISDYRQLNYQLITALALSKKDYIELLKEDVRSYKKILKPFEKNANKDEWDINLDAIRIFFKNVVNGDAHDDEENASEEIEFILDNVVNKSEELLNISEDFIKLRYVKNNLAKLIEKRCRELALGKVTAKAKYQYIAIDGISYMNYAMFRDDNWCHIAFK